MTADAGAPVSGETIANRRYPRADFAIGMNADGVPCGWMTWSGRMLSIGLAGCRVCPYAGKGPQAGKT